jgi:hypothetical protein
MSKEQVDWGAADLSAVYSTAPRLKDSVYRRWIDNLTAFALGRDEAMRKEALRRIDFIETHLLRSTA